MSTLEGKSVASSFKDLLQVSNNNIGVDNVIRAVEDGEGTQSALALSTDTIEIRGSVIPSTNATFDIGSAEYKIRHLFLSDNSLYVGDQQFSSQDVQEVKNLRNGAYATASQGNLAESALQPGSFNFDDLGSKPSTLTGYGITDAATAAQGAIAEQALETANVALKPGGVNFNTDVTDRPVTLGGYGIIDGATKTYVDDSVAGLGSGSSNWSDIENKPTTLAGFGITDAATSAQGIKADSALQPGQAATLTQGTKADTALQPGSHINFVDVVGRPNTLFGYGITDGATTTYVDNAIVSSQGTTDWSNITGTPNTLFGYGITDAATLTQGVKADNALQPGQAATLTQGEKADTALQPNTAIHANTLHLSSGAIFGPSTTYIDPEGIGDNTGRLVVLGDLEVRGTTTQLDSQTLELGLTTLNLAASAEADSQIDGSGIVLGNDLKSLTYSTSQAAWLTDQNFTSTGTVKGYSLQVQAGGLFGWQDNANCVMHYGSHFGWTLFIDNTDAIHVKDTSSATPYYTGMGTIIPEARLHVHNHHGDSSVNVATFESSIDGPASISLKSINSWQTSIESNDDFTFKNSVGDLVHFGGDGFVGVGVTSRFVAGSTMEIHGDDKQLVLKDTDGPYMTHTASSGEIAAFNTNMKIGTSTTQNLTLMAGDNTVATITPTQNFGIGTSSPSSRLSVLSVASSQIADFKSTSSAAGGYIKIAGSTTSGSSGDIFIGNAEPLIIGAENTTGALRTQNDFIIATGGANERLRVTSSGNVGIGTTDPGAYRLKIVGGGLGTEHVVSVASSDPNMLLANPTTEEPYLKFDGRNSVVGLNWTIGLDDDDFTDEENLLAFKRWDDANGLKDTPFVINSSGNVGIGTTSPGAELEVNGQIISNRRFMSENSLELVSDYNNNGDTSIIAFKIDGQGDGNEVMRITSTGNVGIGTTNPSAELEVGDGVGPKSIKIKSGGGSSGDLVFDSASNEGMVRYEHTTDSMRFHTNGSEKARIDSDGHIGFNTTDPRHAVELFGKGQKLALTSDHPDGTRINHAELSSDASGYGYMMVYNDVGNSLARVHSAGTSYFNGGDVGIGTTNPSQKLEVVGHLFVNDGQGIFKRNSASGPFYAEQEGSGPAGVFVGGNVGIGTTDPSHGLTIVGSYDSMLKLIRKEDTNQSAEIHAGAGTVKIKGIDTSDTQHSRFIFETTKGSETLERFRIENNGAFSTNGVTNPLGNVHFTNSGGGSGSRQLQYNTTFDSNSTSGWCSLVNAGASTGVTGVYQNSRSATIGTAANTAYNTDMFGLLYLQKESGANTYLWVDNSQNWRTAQSFTYTGSDAGGTVLGTQTSDERLKNISQGFDYGIEHVLQLEPITYTRKDDTKSTQRLGFGAQTTQQIIPEAVYDTGECVHGYDTDPDDETVSTPKSDDTILAMEYVQLVPVLTKAIQDQQQIIESLKSRIEALENK